MLSALSTHSPHRLRPVPRRLRNIRDPDTRHRPAGTIPRLLSGLLPALAWGLLQVEGACGQEVALHETWGAIYLAEQKIGYTRQASRPDPDADAPEHTSEWETRLVFTRGQTLLELVEKASLVEDGAGRVLRYRYAVDSFAGGTRMTSAVSNGRAEGGAMRVTSGEYERTVKLDDDARGPWFLQRRILRERERGPGHAFDQRLFSPELGRSLGVRIKYGEWETVEVRNERHRLQRVTQTMDIRPRHPDVTWLDDDGVAVVTHVDVPILGQVRIEQCTKEQALVPESPVELMASAVLPSPIRVSAPRATREARYRVAYPPGAPCNVESGERQTVRQVEDGLLDIHVVSPPDDSQLKHYTLPYSGSDEMKEFIRPTAFLESDQPLIRGMAREAVGEERNSLKVARLLERYVGDKIRKKTLDMGFASALETARALRGDCSEHGVLVAALARSLGMPSRIVVGLAYVASSSFGTHHPDGVFLFHVWTELLTAPGQWSPVDAALGTFDATHIALTKSSMDTASPMIDLCLPVLEIVDGLRIASARIPPSPQLPQTGMDE